MIIVSCSATNNYSKNHYKFKKIVFTVKYDSSDYKDTLSIVYIEKGGQIFQTINTLKYSDTKGKSIIEEFIGEFNNYFNPIDQYTSHYIMALPKCLRFGEYNEIIENAVVNLPILLINKNSWSSEFSNESYIQQKNKKLIDNKYSTIDGYEILINSTQKGIKRFKKYFYEKKYGFIRLEYSQNNKSIIFDLIEYKQ